MSGCQSCNERALLVVRGADRALLAALANWRGRDGGAPAAAAPAEAAAPPRGAKEPGKGTRIDVVA